MKYVGKIWKGDKAFESTYEQGNTVNWPLDQLTVKGLKDGIAGKKAGSRVLLVLPPDQGFGDKAQGAIPAKSTLVFALDILAVM